MLPTALPPPGSPDVLYLVDLSGYIFRAYHAITPLSSPSGEPTHATYGTVNMLAKLVNERKPAYLGIALDAPGPTFRRELDARYKAHRPPPPEDLSVQIKRCREIVEAYRIPTFSVSGLEADDLIATLVAHAKERGLKVVIASSDKDLMQLVDGDRVVLWDAMRDKVYGAPEVFAKFGVMPSQVRDFLALVGDTSDNVPGVPGVGLKTAAELLTEFGSVDTIYQRIGEIKKQRIRDMLAQHEAEARISRELVTLRSHPETAFDLSAFRYQGADTERLRDIFRELGFSRFVKSVPAPGPSTIAATYKVILSREALVEFEGSVRAKGQLAIEFHASSHEAMRAHVCGVAMSEKPSEAVYVPISHRYLGAPTQVAFLDYLAIFKDVLQDPKIEKLGHDLKFAEVLLRRFGVELRGTSFDSLLASYLLDAEAANDLEALAQRDGGTTMTKLEAIAPKRRGQPPSLEDVEIDQALPFAAAFPSVVLGLRDRYVGRLRSEKLDKLYSELELPLSHVLAQMESIGVLVDTGVLDGLGKVMADELSQLEKKAHEAAQHEFNLGSPKQLESILFDELNLKVIKKTKTGRSTDAEVLEALADDHPLPGIVLEHRAIAKLLGTYVDALPRLVHPDTGRIHTRWSQAVAATGRISSQDPNLQNIPIRTELGKMIRRAFVAPKGSVLVSADYSQIELRVLAHLSRDERLVDSFQKDEDVHNRTAMEIFGVPLEGVTPEMRRRSKTINFGVIYGMGEAALAKRLRIPRAEAARFIDAYFERYSGVREFMTRTMEEARTHESVRTLLGRKRHLSDLRSSDRVRRAQAERIAQNTPIQGTAADLLKLAMVALSNPVVPGARMVLTVHDELAFEVPEALASEAATKIKHVMETVFPLDVPLRVDVGIGASWALAH